MSRQISSYLLLTAFILTPGCGGGGGGGSNSGTVTPHQLQSYAGVDLSNIEQETANPVIYQGSTDLLTASPAQIRAYMDKLLETQQILGTLLGSDMGNVSTASSNSSYQTPKRLSNDLNKTVSLNTQATVNLQSATTTISETELCASDGTVQYSGTLSDQLTGTVVARYDRCVENNVLLHGEVTMTIYGVHPITLEPQDYTLAFPSLRLISDSTNKAIGGFINNVNMPDPPTTESEYLAITDIDTAASIYFDLEQTSDNLSHLAGVMYLSELGSIRLDGMAPLDQMSSPMGFSVTFRNHLHTPSWLATVTGQSGERFLLRYTQGVIPYNEFYVYSPWNNLLPTVQETNHPPVVDLGPNLVVPADQSGTLYAIEGNYYPLPALTYQPINLDPDGDELTYVWEILAAPANSVLSDSVGNDFSNYPYKELQLDGTVGDYVVSLTVSDGQSTASDTITITAQ